MQQLHHRRQSATAPTSSTTSAPRQTTTSSSSSSSSSPNDNGELHGGQQHHMPPSLNGPVNGNDRRNATMSGKKDKQKRSNRHRRRPNNSGARRHSCRATHLALIALLLALVGLLLAYSSALFQLQQKPDITSIPQQSSSVPLRHHHGRQVFVQSHHLAKQQLHLPQDVVLPHSISSSSSSTLTLTLPDKYFNRNFGGLDLEFSSSAFQRVIAASNDEVRYNEERDDFLDHIDEEEVDERWLHDDDYDYPLECYRNNWETKQLRLNCNMFHEETMDRLLGKFQPYDVTYLGRGTYRASWLYEPKMAAVVATNPEDAYGFVWKSMIFGEAWEYDMVQMGQTRVDAVVMEQLASSPRITDIYGFCSTSVFSERLVDDVQDQMFGEGEGYLSPQELKQQQHHPRNSMSLTEKLDMAIVMAEALADIHGFEGGVIMHGDFHSPQWLRSMKGEIKLNDFNKAKILRFNRKTNEYCDINRCYQSSYRAPEDNACADGNESSDTFSFGNNIYVLLTGLWPYYDYVGRERKDLYHLIAEGEVLPTVDARFRSARSSSPIEAGLVKIMEQCWEYDHRKRISIFSVLEQLYELRKKTTTKATG